MSSFPVVVVTEMHLEDQAAQETLASIVREALGSSNDKGVTDWVEEGGGWS